MLEQVNKERPQLNVNVQVNFERRIKELTYIISVNEMMIEMAKNEINVLQNNAQSALQKHIEKEEKKEEEK